ncbi:prs [Symbiodinium sp. CCMP2456]|nr:prs [Symbiodinium sp. CCMP2456]
MASSDDDADLDDDLDADESYQAIRIPLGHPPVVFGLPGSDQLLQEVISHLQWRSGECHFAMFDNGEIGPKVLQTVTNHDVFVIIVRNDAASEVNFSLVRLLLLVDALRGESPHRLTVVMPCLEYARQDRKLMAGEAIAPKLMFRCIKTAGAERFLTVDLHNQAEAAFSPPGMVLDELSSDRYLADFIRKNVPGFDEEHSLVCATNGGGMKFTRRMADILRVGFIMADRFRQKVSYNYEFASGDQTFPTLIQSVPGNLAEGVDPNLGLQFVFSEVIVAGAGLVELLALGDVRVLSFADGQVTMITSGAYGNRSIAVSPALALRPDLEYNIRLRADVVRDLAGNPLQYCNILFRTGGSPENFVVFAPYIQEPIAPLVVSFRTSQHGLYGSTDDLYRLELSVENSTLLDPPSRALEGCSSVLEISETFPALQECRFDGGRFILTLQSPLQSSTEYTFVLQWPISSGGSDERLVTWNMVTARTYAGDWIEVQQLIPWRHRLVDHLQLVLPGSDVSVLSLEVAPAAEAFANSSDGQVSGPETLREYDFSIQFGGQGMLAGSRLRIIGSPLIGWSTEASRPVNTSMLTSLLQMPWNTRSGPWRQTRGCGHFFPGDFPAQTACELLEYNVGGPTYGMELRLPSSAATLLPQRPYTFSLSVPGIKQPLAAAVRWETILSQSVGGIFQHSPVTASGSVMLSNTTQGMSLEVLSSTYKYPAPMGSILSRVEMELKLGVFAPPGPGSVIVELLEPAEARMETCEPIAGIASLGEKPPAMSLDGTTSRASWQMESDASQRNFVVYPRVAYRTACLVYNGPSPLMYSTWRLAVEVLVGSSALTFDTLTSSSKYFVVPAFASAQVLPTHPVLGRFQILLIRAAMPERDGFSLTHWTSSAHRLQLLAPSGFAFPDGPCPGFWPLSSLPPVPRTSCVAAAPKPLAVDVQMDSRDVGFQPGESYAFQVSVENPPESFWSTASAEELRLHAYGWSLTLIEDHGMPVALMENIPLVQSSVTAALRPGVPASIYDSSFRLYKTQISILAIFAEDQRAGQVSRVQVDFMLQTPLRTGDSLVVTAPSLFSWVMPAQLYEPLTTSILQRFPTIEPEIDGASPWILRVDIQGTARSELSYAIAADVMNPTSIVWKKVDATFNYWQLESLYRYLPFTSFESRRDVGVRRGYDVIGALQYCAAVPTSRLRGHESWVSLSLQLAEPLGVQSWREPELPSIVRVLLPQGFSVAASSGHENNCSSILETSADPGNPRLPALQFPREYSSLPDVDSLQCGTNVQRSELTLSFPDVSDVAGLRLLPHVVYAFRLRVQSPRFDQIRGQFWSVETVTAQGEVRQRCSVSAWEFSDPLQGVSTVTGLPMAPTLVATFKLQLQGSALLQFSTGISDISLELQAPSGFVFFPDCAAKWPPIQPETAWQLTGCTGSGAVARVDALQLALSEALEIGVTVRMPAWKDHGQTQVWSIRSMVQGVLFEATALMGPSLTEIGDVRLQPLSSILFRAEAVIQSAVLSFVPATELLAGAFLEVALPGQHEFVFVPEAPCLSLIEDPQSLLPQVSEVQTSQFAQSCDLAATCTWPQLFDCWQQTSSSSLRVQIAAGLVPGERYCIGIHASVPEGRSVPAFPLRLQLLDESGVVLEVAPLVGQSRRGLGVAPVVQTLAHLSLCYPGRLPSTEPVDVALSFALSSLILASTDQRLSARFCLLGLDLPSNVPLTCTVLEPSTARVTCRLLSGCGTCVSLESNDLWMPFERVIMSFPAVLSAGAFPSVDMELLTSSTGASSVLQGKSYMTALPILPILPLTIVAPVAPTLDTVISVYLEMDWQEIATGPVSLLLSPTGGESPALLDVSLPFGLTAFAGTACSPVQCQQAPPDEAAPEPVLRFLLQRPIGSARRLRRLQSVAVSIQDLPGQLQVHLFATAPVSAQNDWRFVLRTETLKALGAIALPGFAVVYPVSLGVQTSSQRAGSLFSRFVLEFKLSSSLPAGSFLHIRTPSGIVSEPDKVEPEYLFEVASLPPSWLDMTSALVFRALQTLAANVAYTVNVPMINPILMPASNEWLVQVLESDFAETGLPNSIGRNEGFEVFGEFEHFGISVQSAVPLVSAPALVQFKLRTPLPPTEELSKSFQLRITNIGATGNAKVFDPANCVLDTIRTSRSLPAQPAEKLLLTPYDCLVSSSGLVADLMFDQQILAKQDYYFWIWMQNPDQISWLQTFAASTIAGDQVVHQTSFFSSALLTLRGWITPGSHAAGASHRSVVSIYAGRSLRGQRGSIELQLPPGFLASCHDFRPRGALPATARCRSLESRVQVYWRSLFGRSELSPPYEFAFGLTNPAVGLPGVWTATIFQGENQDFAVDASGSEGMGGFDVCEPMANISLRREDASVISLVLSVGADVPASFDLLLRVELRSSLTAQAYLQCPETSLWQPRENLQNHISATAQGLPRFTTCVEEPGSDLEESEYTRSARQHSSAVLFLLPYARFYGGGEALALEVRMRREAEGFSVLEPSMVEAASEMVNVNLEVIQSQLKAGGRGEVKIMFDAEMQSINDVIIIDDMFDTCGNLVEVGRALHTLLPSARLYGVAPHGYFSGDTADKVKQLVEECNLQWVAVTNSVDQTAALQRFAAAGLEERIKVIEISKLLAGRSMCTVSSCCASSYA